MKKKIIVFIIIISSIILNIFFITFDRVIPSFSKRISKPEYFSKNDNPKKIELAVVEASYKMFTSKKLQMPWKERTDFISRLYAIKTKMNSKIHSYPRAYLSLGLIEYAFSKNDSLLLNKVKSQFDEFYVNKNGVKFKIDVIDKTPIALSALILYKHFKEDKYKVMVDKFYQFLTSQVIVIDNYPIILHRKFHNSKDPKLMLVDVVGMICPFLIEYSKIFNIPEAAKLAESEVLFYTKYGLDNDTFLPFHAINLTTKDAFGPNNWGRGIAWYMLGLKSVYNYQIQKNTPNSQLIDLTSTFLEEISHLKYKNIYTQFPGTSDEFDSSASTMLLYATKGINKNKINSTELTKLLAQYIRKSGEIDYCSGDTDYVNKYAKQFGLSELSQGFLLRLLSLD